MNRMLCYIFLLFLGLISVCFATNKTVINGFDDAESFRGTSDHLFYIRAESFIKKSNAIACQAFLQSKTTYSVNISQETRWFVVIIGPIDSVAELKKTASVCKKRNQLSHQKKVDQEQPTLSPVLMISQKQDSRKRSIKSLVTFTVGPDFVQGNKAQLVTLWAPFQNYYTINGNHEVVADGGIFLGVEHPLTKTLTAQLGVAGYMNSKLTPQGHVWQFAEPAFDNLTYAYHIQHSRVMLAGKLLSSFAVHQAIHPYFSWEVGAAFNHASGYQETSFTSEVFPMEPFANHSQSSFAYGVGLGIDYYWNQHTRLGAGYQFANLGSVSLGVSPATTTAETLSIPHLYTNQLRFQLTFII